MLQKLDMVYSCRQAAIRPDNRGADSANIIIIISYSVCN